MRHEDLSIIVFSGGGVRGFSYVGACLAFLDTYKCTVGSHFKTFAGTSVGALFALITSAQVNIGHLLHDLPESIFCRLLLNLHSHFNSLL